MKEIWKDVFGYEGVYSVSNFGNVNNIKFNTQLKSLVEFGILDLLEILKANVDESTYLKQTQKVKVLLEPTGMGDRFKTLNVRK